MTGRYWMQDVREGMEKRGTKGSFGKATKKKIAAGKKKGGKARKRAVLAQTFKKIAAKRKGKRVARKRG